MTKCRFKRKAGDEGDWMWTLTVMKKRKIDGGVRLSVTGWDPSISDRIRYPICYNVEYYYKLGFRWIEASIDVYTNKEAQTFVEAEMLRRLGDLLPREMDDGKLDKLVRRFVRDCGKRVMYKERIPEKFANIGLKDILKATKLRKEADGH